jgi:hypothetical protein
MKNEGQSCSERIWKFCGTSSNLHTVDMSLSSDCEVLRALIAQSV